jgi:hypothetical protein
MSPIPLPNQPYPEPTPADPNPGPARPPAPGETPLPEPIGVPSTGSGECAAAFGAARRSSDRAARDSCQPDDAAASRLKVLDCTRFRG